MRYAVLICLAAAFSLLSFYTPASFTVQGKVTDDKGNPVVGVSVSEKGTNTATTTDGQGDFKLTVRNEKSVLIFLSVGFDRKEVAIKSKAVINVSMSVISNELEEVVVVGYGVEKKRDITGSTTSIAIRGDRKSVV